MMQPPRRERAAKYAGRSDSVLCLQPDLERDIHSVSNELRVGEISGAHVEAQALYLGIPGHAEFPTDKQVVAVRRQCEPYRLRGLDTLELEVAVCNIFVGVS